MTRVLTGVPSLPRWTKYRALMMCGVVMIGGCSMSRKVEQPQKAPPPTLMARHTPKPVKVDGVLDDEAWRAATVYQMSLSMVPALSRPSYHLLEEYGVLELVE